MSMANENYDTGGTGGAIFGGPAGGQAAKPPGPTSEPIGDEYVAPKGLPGWKQPEMDDDDRIDPERYRDQKTTILFLSRCFPDPTQAGLAVAKVFYFFFYGAFGTLFPLIGVYFKGLGMDTAQAGLLSGIRPIVEYLAIPFWNKIASKLQKGKIMMLLSLVCWIGFTVPIGHIHPPVVSCKFYNETTEKIYLQEPRNYDETRRRKRNAIGTDDTSSVLTPDTVAELPYALPLVNNHEYDLTHGHSLDSSMTGRSRVKRNVPEVTGPNQGPWKEGYVLNEKYVVGKSPQVITFVDDQMQHKTWVSPRWNNEVFERAAVHKVFFLIFLLIVVGEFFSSPAVALADSAVFTLLGEENHHKYGTQRMFGSIGWAVTMFVMGMVLDHSKLFQNAKCPMSRGQRNYDVCFFAFAAYMSLALIVATQIPFRYLGRKPGEAVQMNNIPEEHQKKPDEKKDKLKQAKVFAQTLRGMPNFIAVFKAMANLRMLMIMLVAWVMGIGMGLIFTFLFWHLQDYGGTPTLFGIASVLNHISEMAAYFYSFKIISKFGHIKVLALGLLCNVIRFIYISFITWPWLILPIEIVQGITHAAVWAACCSFIAHNTDAELRPSAQSFIQGMHHGFGKFCGSVFGGMLIQELGSVMVFRIYGAVCAVFFILFIAVNFFNREEGKFMADLPDDMDPKNMAQESAPFAPHGVPGGAKPTMLENTEDQYNAPGGGANNPFLQEDTTQQYSYTADGKRIEGNQDQYYGAGYSQAQSGYSSSGFGLQ